MADHGKGERNPGAGIGLILEELRDLRLELRADRARADEEWRQSDERFERLLHDFREDTARREAATQRAFRDIRTVGLAIVKTLNHHTRLLERMDRKLGSTSGGARCTPGSWRRSRRFTPIGSASRSSGWRSTPCGVRCGRRPWRTCARPPPRPWRAPPTARR